MPRPGFLPVLVMAATLGCEAFRSDAENFSRQRDAATSPDGRDGDHWQVDGERLCVLNGAFSADEHCYRLATQPDGRMHYYVADPGNEADRLLTKVTDRVIDGPPDP
jgi:hypothetical protein